MVDEDGSQEEIDRSSGEQLSLEEVVPIKETNSFPIILEIQILNSTDQILKESAIVEIPNSNSNSNIEDGDLIGDHISNDPGWNQGDTITASTNKENDSDDQCEDLEVNLPNFVAKDDQSLISAKSTKELLAYFSELDCPNPKSIPQTM
ncbi:hypothetical protein ACH5RR_029407 [Cinchona calisaya]|uniref:Uncharacterized protein n=1 Tax=Cinchona calisaya TaxID=153742 RepID=A0ABD2YRK1_9GENT